MEPHLKLISMKNFRLGCMLAGFLSLVISLPAQTFTTLHSFDGTDGSNPIAALTQASDGNFFGEANHGGANSVGTIFKMSSKGRLKTLHTFCSGNNCADGAFPSGGLIRATDGNFYGVTVYGGVLGVGTVFKMTPSGKLTTVYNFCSVQYCDDGSAPNAGLIQASDGNFYGTTTTGGSNQPNQIGLGVIYKLTPAGELTTLYSFCPEGGDPCLQGSTPIASLVQGANNKFYGTAVYGGADNDGTLFSLSAGLDSLLESSQLPAAWERPSF